MCYGKMDCQGGEIQNGNKFRLKINIPEAIIEF